MSFDLLRPPVICADPIPPLRRFFANGRYTTVGALVDEHTRQACYPLIADALPPHALIVAPADEPTKTLETCQWLWSRFIEEKIDRHSALLILGGGVLGDMGGFCAATFKRGIDFALMPTTLLAQVDASMGGKLGINFGGYKNQIGVFREPNLTLIAPMFLRTLPKRELRAGLAEIVKHCLIADAEAWSRLYGAPWDSCDWPTWIERSMRIKMNIARRDPEERGARKALNFGHTIGHAIESLLLPAGMIHGEAVAAGMIMEAHISLQRNYIDAPALEQIAHYLLDCFGYWELPANEQILDRMRQDKKNIGDDIMMTLLRPVGCAVWDVKTSPAEVYAATAYYRAMA